MAALPPLSEPRLAKYGQRWGEGAARCFSIDLQALDEEECVRLMPIPGCFVCPISQEVMVDPVATADGSVYERAFIEHWFREQQQRRQPIRSPATGLELPSKLLVPLVALQRAVEAYLAHRPELQASLANRRCCEEAIRMLEADLGEKCAAKASVEEVCDKLQAQVTALQRTVQKKEEQLAMMRNAVRVLISRLRTQEDAMVRLRRKCKRKMQAAKTRCAELQNVLTQTKACGEECLQKMKANYAELEDRLAQASTEVQRQAACARQRAKQLQQARRWNAVLQHELHREGRLTQVQLLAHKWCSGWKEEPADCLDDDKGSATVSAMVEGVIDVEEHMPVLAGLLPSPVLMAPGLVAVPAKGGTESWTRLRSTLPACSSADACREVKVACCNRCISAARANPY